MTNRHTTHTRHALIVNAQLTGCIAHCCPVHAIRWCDTKTDIHAIGVSTNYLLNMIFGDQCKLKPHHPCYQLRMGLLRMAKWCTAPWHDLPTAEEVHAYLTDLMDGTSGLRFA